MRNTRLLLWPRWCLTARAPQSCRIAPTPKPRATSFIDELSLGWLPVATPISGRGRSLVGHGKRACDSLVGLEAVSLG